MDVFLTILTIIILICLWIVLYDSNRFVVVRHTYSDERIKASLRIVVVADLHNKRYGKDNEKLLAAIEGEKPDLVLAAGDILTARPGKKLDTAVHFLEGIHVPIYYADGNHEHRLQLYPEKYGDMRERYDAELHRLGVHHLINTREDLAEYGISIYGSQIDKFYYKRFRVQPMDSAYMKSILGDASDSFYNILLAHNPDYFPQYAAWGADLVLSGHVHGGIARIPLWGRGVVSPNVRLFPKYDGGEFKEGKATMVLSRGLGMHTIPVRFCNPGELIVIDLVPEKEKPLS